MSLKTKAINIATALLITFSVLGTATSAQATGFVLQFGFGNGYSSGYSNHHHNHYGYRSHYQRTKKKCWYKKVRVWSKYHGHHHWKKRKVCRRVYY